MTQAFSTIVGAIQATDTSFSLTSGTGVTASIFQAATNPAVGIQTYLLVEEEIMQIISGTFASGVSPVNVKRGMLGTRAMPHAALTPFIFGTNIDFQSFRPAVAGFMLTQPDSPNMGASAAVASTATIQIPGPLFHLTGTTSITNMQPPTSALLSQSGPNSVENYINGYRVSIICDGAAQFTSGGGGSGPAIALTTTARTALSFIDFILDTSSGVALWYPSVKST